MHRSMARYGLVLILLALLTGIAVPSLALPRLGLSAHTIGLLGGTLLIAIAAIWPMFRLGDRPSRWCAGTWVYAIYTNWLGCLVGAATGSGRMTPMAADGATGSAAAEAIVVFLLASGSLAAFIAVGLALRGIGGNAPDGA